MSKTKIPVVVNDLFASNASHRLWKYAVIVADTNGNLYVKDGDHRSNTREEALDYAASQSTGKARGLVLEEDVLGAWDMTLDAISRNRAFDPTQTEENYKKGYDNEIRPLMPLKRVRKVNFRRQQSLELHPIPSEYIKETPNWRQQLAFEWDQAHQVILNGGNALPLDTYKSREYLVESFDKTSKDIYKFLLAAATGAGKETSTLALLIHLHDVKQCKTTALNVAVATIPSTISELMNELASVAGMNVPGYGFIDYSRIQVYIMRQWYNGYRKDCSPRALCMIKNRAIVVDSVADIPKTHMTGMVPVLFGSYHDLAQKSGTLSTRYHGLEKRIGTLSIGEAHQMLGNADNKMWQQLNDMFGKKCFKLFVTGTPYDFIYGNAAAEYFDTNERALFTRNDLYKHKRLVPGSDFAQYPDFNFYGIDVEEVVVNLKLDPNWKDDAEGFTWSKLFTYNPEAKKFLYEKTVLWLFKRMFGSTAFDENGDPLSIYNAKDLCNKAKQHIMVALPIGNKNASAEVYIGALKLLLVRHGIFEGDVFEAYSDDLGDRKEDIANAQGRTLTLTCNKDCTGANIPELGSFVFLRNLGDSVKFFEQATGRVGRRYPGKTNCGVFIGALEASMNIMVTIEEKISLERGEDFSSREIIETMLANYNFFSARNGQWVQLEIPDLAAILEELNARGNYGINQCVNFTTAGEGFDLLFKNTTSAESKKVDINGNNNKGARDKGNHVFEQLGLPFDKKSNPDQNWNNMKLSFIAKCRWMAYVYNLETVAQCVSTVEHALATKDNEVLSIIGRGAEWFPQVMQPGQIDVRYTNRWIQKFNDHKNDIEKLFEMLEDPIHRSNNGFVAEPNRLLRRFVSRTLDKLKKKKQIKLLDPCGGRGGFIVYFIKEALSQGIDIDPKNVYYNDADHSMVSFFRALNKNNNLNIPEKNITCENFLTKGFTMKFNVILQNPPYNGKAALHQQFFNKGYELLEDNGTMAIIQPATTYFNKKDKQKGPVDDMIELIQTNKCEVFIENPEVFDNAGIQNDLSITILEKISSASNVIEKITYKNGQTYTDVALEDISMTQIAPPVYASIRKKYENFVEQNGNLEDKINKDIGVLKAVLGKIRGTRPTDDDFYTFIPLPGNRKGYGASKETDFGVKIKTIKEADYVYNYLESYVARFGLALLKFSQNTANKEFALVPLVPFTKNYTDNELYKMVGLTKQEVIEIKKVIVSLYGR